MSAAPRTPEECAKALAEAFRKQTEIFRAIAELSSRQQPLIEKDDADALLRVLSEKQRLIAAREQQERTAAPLRAAWETMRDRAAPAVRASVEKAFEELLAVMTEVVNQEEVARTHLEQRQAHTTQQVARVQTGKAMLKAYGGAIKSGNKPARFQDKKG